MTTNDSHLSVGDKQNPAAGAVKQHHRMAMGEKITGTSNPNGAKSGPTDNRIANNEGKTY